MTDKKIFCEVLESITYSERCLYELSKVIEGNKTCESCIYRELQRLRRGIVIQEEPQKKSKTKRRRTRADRKTAKDINGLKDIKETNGMKESLDTQGLRTLLDKETDDLRKSLDDQGLGEDLKKSAQDLRTVLVLNIHDLSRLLGKSERRIQELAKEGKIPGAHKAGPHWAFNKEEVDAWLLKKTGATGISLQPKEEQGSVRPQEEPELSAGVPGDSTSEMRESVAELSNGSGLSRPRIPGEPFFPIPEEGINGVEKEK